MIAQAAAVAQGSVSSGCSRQSAAGDGRGASGGGVAHGSSVSSAAGGRVAGSGRRRWMTGRRWRAGSGHRRWKLWLLGAKDELLLPRRIAYQVSSAMDGGSL
jgi:hypothetical protein